MRDYKIIGIGVAALILLFFCFNNPYLSCLGSGGRLTSSSVDESKKNGSFIGFYEVSGNSKGFMPIVKQAWLERAHYQASLVRSNIKYYDKQYDVIIDFYEAVDTPKYEFILYNYNVTNKEITHFGYWDRSMSKTYHEEYDGFPDTLVLGIRSWVYIEPKGYWEKYSPLDTMWLRLRKEENRNK